MATTRKLKITGQKPITKMKLKNGGETTLYEVFAVDEHDGFIEEPLRAFTELEIGQVLEYEIQPYNHPRWGMSYTLIPPKRETARRIRDLEEAMESVLQWAESKGYKPEPPLTFRREEKPLPSLQEAGNAAADAGVKGKEVPIESTPAPDRPDLDEKFGKEAPWDDGDLGPTPPEETVL